MPNKKLAAVVTVYRKYSHGQHIVDRFLDGYGWNGEFHHPPFDLVGMYVDQVGADDLSRERGAPASVHENYPTIAEALTLGTGNSRWMAWCLWESTALSEDGERAVQYPRYEFFKQIVEVYKRVGGVCRCSMISISRGIGRGRRRCTTRRRRWTSDLWRGRVCR